MAALAKLSNGNGSDLSVTDRPALLAPVSFPDSVTGRPETIVAGWAVRVRLPVPPPPPPCPGLWSALAATGHNVAIAIATAIRFMPVQRAAPGRVRQFERDTGRMDEARRRLLDEGYAAINSGDVEAALRHLDPEVEIVTSGAFLDRGAVYRGHDGVREFLGMLDEAFADHESARAAAEPG